MLVNNTFDHRSVLSTYEINILKKIFKGLAI